MSMAQKKTLQRRMPLVLGSIILALCLFLMALFVPYSTVARANNELDMGTKEETWKYIHIAVKDTSLYFNDFSSLGSQMHPLVQMPESFDATVIFNFNNVLYEGKSVFVTGIVRVNRVMSGSVYNYHMNFADNVKVNIRDSYYNYFQDKSLSNFSVMWYKNSTGWKGYTKGSVSTFNNVVTFSTAPKPDGADDPESPDFELGDGGGLDTSPIYKQAQSFWTWFLGIWGSTKPLNVFWQVLTVVLGVVALALVVKFTKWLFGK